MNLHQLYRDWITLIMISLLPRTLILTYLIKLNENDMFSSFFDAILSHSLYPQITLLIRFTRTTGTLIDNLLCKLHKSILENTAGILTKRLSDHQPYFMIMHNAKNIHFLLNM